MDTVRLGRSGLEVTRIGFGSIPMQRLNDQDAVRVVRAALDGGLNWIDTANAYGTSEERIGKAIAGYDRSSLKVFTKSHGKDPGTVRSQVELSLERLGLSYLDLFQFHLVPSPEEWRRMEEGGTLEAALRLRDEGMIRHLGASAHNPDAALAVAGDPRIEVLQYPFNFIVNREAEEVLESCRRHDVGFIAMKPFGGGALGRASACIRFLMSYPGIVTDPGFEKLEEVEEVLALWREGAPLSPEDRAAIERLRSELGTRFCRRCGYCAPCPNGVEIVTLMSADSLVKRFPVERLTTGWPAEARESADLCIECRECEEKCPYELPITEQIRQGAEALRRAVAGR